MARTDSVTRPDVEGYLGMALYRDTAIASSQGTPNLRAAIRELCAYIKYLETGAQPPAVVWAVMHVVGPAMVESLWATREAAQRRADLLGNEWRGCDWAVLGDEDAIGQ